MSFSIFPGFRRISGPRQTGVLTVGRDAALIPSQHSGECERGRAGASGRESERNERLRLPAAGSACGERAAHQLTPPGPPQQRHVPQIRHT